jgi:serine/threonine protein phosphatase 1
MSGRVIAIGDIHGCLTAFDALLREIELQPDDLLITHGDYVDRGPDSRGVIERLISLSNGGGLIALRGNHELMMMRARNSMNDERFWRHYGGEEALESYALAGRPGRLNDVPDAHWRFMASTCRDWYETESYIFVHAGVNPFVPMDEQDEQSLFWIPLTDIGVHCSGKTVICGHTEQRDGRPRDLGHTTCIDTWAYGGGWLTALNVATDEYWQANEEGETRQGSL